MLEKEIKTIGENTLKGYYLILGYLVYSARNFPMLDFGVAKTISSIVVFIFKPLIRYYKIRKIIREIINSNTPTTISTKNLNDGGVYTTGQILDVRFFSVKIKGYQRDGLSVEYGEFKIKTFKIVNININGVPQIK